MIVILKREDLPQELRHRTVESLELEHVELSPGLIEQAELIVFVDGAAVKFLKQHEGIQSMNSLEVLVDYITSIPTFTRWREPWSLKPFGQRRTKR